MKLVIIILTILNVVVPNNKDIKLHQKSNKVEIKKKNVIKQKNAKKDIKLQKNTNKKEEFINKLKENYSKREQIKCDFKQKFYHKAYKRIKKSSGNLYIKNDMKMKWEYNKPEKKFIISNSKILWIYEPENEQAFKTKIKGSDIEVISRFLTGKLDLFSNYKLTLIKNNTLLLEPKTKKSFKSIKLIVDDNFNIVKTIVVDNFDNINTIEYLNINSNFKKLNNSFFEFIPGDDIEIISN